MKIIVATRNRHKLVEIRALLGSVADQFEILAAGDLRDMPDVVEDAVTLEGNARKKAYETASVAAKLFRGSQFIVLADDTGLEVDALGGAPGVFSARFAQYGGLTPPSVMAETKVSYHDNNVKLLKLLDGLPAEKRGARFRCVIAIVESCAGRSPTVVEGICDGHIGAVECGANGFGYDPLFIPLGSDKTFAELTEEEKNRISHRGRALAKARDVLRNLV